MQREGQAFRQVGSGYRLAGFINEYDRQLGDTTIKERKLYIKVHQFSLLSYLAEQEEAPAKVAEDTPVTAGEIKKSKRSRS